MILRQVFLSVSHRVQIQVWGLLGRVGTKGGQYLCTAVVLMQSSVSLMYLFLPHRTKHVISAKLPITGPGP